MFELPSLKDVSEVVIDKSTVETKKEPIIVYKSEKKKSDKKVS
jgi:ATP-dependent Clp protease ATP-binding subunit ClpX